MSYRVSLNELGQVDAMNRVSDGATVPFEDESDELTIELREWEAENGVIDLSDHFVAPPIKAEPPNYQGFYDALLSEGVGLFGIVRGLASLDLSVNACYTDLIAAIGFGKLPGFQMSISNLILVMRTVQPFSSEQMMQIRLLLDANGFESVTLP